MTGFEAPAIVLILSLLGKAARAVAPSTPAPGPAPQKDQGAPPAPPATGAERWPRTVPKGGARPITRTWPATMGGADAWRKDRMAQVLAWLRGPAKLTAAELQNARDIALAVMAHWDMEAASGVAEYNFNAGGIGARPGDAYFASKDAQSQPPKEMAFTAYDNFPQFIADYFGVLALPRYAEALNLLLTNPGATAWIRALRKGGYYGADENVVAQGWDARRTLVAKATVGMT